MPQWDELPADVPDSLRAYRAVVELPVLWGDMDAFRHVNNAIYLKWFESSRVAMMHQRGLYAMLRGEGLGPILASITCNYRRQVTFPDQVLIGARVVDIGRTSLRIEHLVYSREQQRAVADGQSLIVVFHYDRQRPVRVPDFVRSEFGL